MKNIYGYIILLLFLQAPNNLNGQEKNNFQSSRSEATEWLMHNFSTSRMEKLTIEGNPKLIESPYGKAVLFDGKNDGFFLEYTPLVNLEEFTVEVIMRPDSQGLEEQRFLHLGEMTGERIMLETRLTRTGFWYVDGYVKSQGRNLILIDSTKLHPLNKWYNVSMVNKKGEIKLYINGETEHEGRLPFIPFQRGKCSIGVRQNKLYWFKGAIYKIKITPSALKPEDLLRI